MTTTPQPSAVPPPAPATAPTWPASPQPTSEIEYKQLTSFFKYLVTITLTAVSIIAAVAGALLYRSVSDIKTDAQNAIGSTRDAATHEISKIQSTSAQIAQEEAKKRIDEAFQKDNIQRLIDRTARERVNAAVDKAIENDLAARIADLQHEVAEIGEVSNAGARLRLGFAEGLDTLLAKEKSTNKYVSDYAKSTLVAIGGDYDKRLGAGDYGGTAAGTKLMAQEITPPPTTIREVMAFIRSHRSANGTAAAFAGFREMTGAKVSTFDVQAAEKWCVDNRPRCEK